MKAKYCVYCGKELQRREKEPKTHFAKRQFCNHKCYCDLYRQPHPCGVYQILNRLNGKCYVGSSIDIRRRWRHHREMLAGNKHHSIHLQRAWNKYGKANFVFRVLELVENKDDLVIREQYWIDTLDSFRNGYNRTPRAASTLGYKYTEEGCQNISRAQRERFLAGKSDTAKLTPKQVAEVKERIYAGESASQTAKDYGVSLGVVYGIRNQKHFTYVEGPVLTPEQTKEINLHNRRKGLAKLTPNDVTAIREESARGISREELADRYSVTSTTISHIRLGRTWKDVPGPILLPSEHRRNKLSANDAHAIRERLANGEDCKSIAVDYPVKPKTVFAIKRGYIWKGNK